MDSGPLAHFINCDKARALKLRTKTASPTLTSLSAGTTQRVNQLLATMLNDSIDDILFVLPKVKTKFCHTTSTFRKCGIYTLNTDDTQFNVASTVDVLLRALHNRNKDNGFYMRESIFGWIVSGSVKTTTADCEVNFFSCHVTTTSTTGSLLSNFWATEEVPECKRLTLEETQDEDHFFSTTKRNQEERFVLRMPSKGRVQTVTFYELGKKTDT